MYCKAILVHVILPVHCDTMNLFKIHHFVFFYTLKQFVLCDRSESQHRDDYFSFGALCLSLSTHTCAHAYAPVLICWHTRLGDGTHSWHLFILCSPEIFSTKRLWTVVFWDGMSCGLVGNDRHFRSTCCFNLKAKLCSLLLWRQTVHVTPKHSYPPPRLHCVTNQKTTI